MSRTKRFRKSTHLIKDNRILEDLVRRDGWHWDWVKMDPSSEEAKKALAKFHSDAKKGVMRWRGPGWYHRLFSQIPYRNRSKREISRYLKGEIDDIVLENKPKRLWYY